MEQIAAFNRTVIRQALKSYATNLRVFKQFQWVLLITPCPDPEAL
jgi:hypothetical protein